MVVTGVSPAEPVGDAVRRVAYRRLQPAVEALRLSSGADVDDVVHDVRKRCKRVRALLRLVRGEIGDDVYHRENRVLRDSARALSAMRDAAVLVHVHDEVVRAGAMPLAGYRMELVERHNDLQRQVLEEGILPNVRERLATVVVRSQTWPIGMVEWDVLGAGLKRVYRRGRKAMAAAYEEPSAESFHQWRKRAKYFRHQLSFLHDLWPEVIGGTENAAHALTDLLGDEHDLAMLRNAAVAAGCGPEREAEPFAEFIESRRALLRTRAQPIGLRLYAEKPSRFIGRLGRYWDAGVRRVTAA